MSVFVDRERHLPSVKTICVLVPKNWTRSVTCACATRATIRSRQFPASRILEHPIQGDLLSSLPRSFLLPFSKNKINIFCIFFLIFAFLATRIPFFNFGNASFLKVPFFLTRFLEFQASLRLFE